MAVGNVELVHGNSKNEIRQNMEECNERGVRMERSKAGMKKTSPNGHLIARASPSRRNASNQWMNYLTNLRI